MGRRNSRRDFLKQGAAAGLGFWTLGGVALALEPKGSNEQIQMACIGVGGKGEGDSVHAAMFGKIVAICDIDEQRLNARSEDTKKFKDTEKFKDATKFFDFREMLDKLG